MNIRTLALVLGSAMVVAASGVAATACSSSTNGGSGSGGADASHGDTGSSSSGSSSGGGSGSSSGSSGDDGGGEGGSSGGPDCGSTPTQHPSDAGTIFCAPKYFTEAGVDLFCPTGQQCCLGGALGGGQFAPEVCSTWGTACTNGGGDAGSANQQPIAVECEQIADCHANGNSGATACCLKGAKCASGYTCAGTQGACPFPKWSDGTTIVCEGTGGDAATACAAGETQVCGSDTDCPNGLHCTAGKYKILQLGFCQ
jgi:hypothetical protein